MAKGVNIAAFESGSLRLLSSGEKPNEVVLALPLSSLLVRVVRISEENLADPESYCKPLLQAISPFPDEDITVSCETIRTSESGAVVIAAAFPEGASGTVADELDRLKLNVTRIDAIEFGEIRHLWNEIAAEGERKLVLIHGADGVSVMVLEDCELCTVRSLSPECDLKREIMLSLLEAEDFCGARKLSEIVLVRRMAAEGVEASSGWAETLATFAPVRTVEVADEDAALRGVAERSEEPGTINALPASWADVLEESRFKRKLIKFVAAAVGVWAVVIAVLIAVPLAYGVLSDRQKDLCRKHSRQYREVKSTKEKCLLVRKYRDHSLGALEIMKAVSDGLPPEGIELNSWNFKRGEGVRLSGEAESAELVFDFKDSMADIMLETDGETQDDENDAKALFKTVNLTGPVARGAKQRFDLECVYGGEEDEEE